MKMNLVRAAAVAAVWFSATSAHALPVNYTDFATWSSAVNGTAAVTIPDPSPDGFIYFGTGDGSVTYSGVTFSSSLALGDGNFYNIGPVFSGLPAVLSSQEETTGLANILITFSRPTTAFALDYGTFNGSAVTFKLSNGYTFSQPSTVGGYDVPDFVGVTDTAFTSVLVTSPDIVLNLNSLVYGVPELSTWVMLLLGFVGLGLVAFGRSKPESQLGDRPC